MEHAPGWRRCEPCGCKLMLRVDQITKQFGALTAVNSVSFESGAGEVVAVLGENGAGKTTLLSCIAGFIACDSGQVLVDGGTLKVGDPADAIRHGVGTAFQHFSMVPVFTVEESFSLAGLPESTWARHLSERISKRARIDELSIAERQQVEFLKARLIGVKVLLLDEPTSPLGDIDVDRVLRDIASAADAGATVLFVTHRLREALAVADRILVMRHGFMVGSWSKPSNGWGAGTELELVSAMFGADRPTADVMPRVKDDRASAGMIAVTDLSNRRRTELAPGKVLVVLGIAGNGQQRLTRLLSGESAVRVELLDADGASAIHDAEWLRRHATVIPEDRIGEGVAPEMSVGETLVLRDLAQGRLQSAGWVSRRSLAARARSMIASWQISPDDPSSRVGALSGGNIQRVVLARALDPTPSLLVAVNPAQGLDLATAESVRERLRDAAASGAAVVSLEQDVDDALRYADDVSVLFQGNLSSPVRASEADQRQLQMMMVAGW